MLSYCILIIRRLGTTHDFISIRPFLFLQHKQKKVSGNNRLKQFKEHCKCLSFMFSIVFNFKCRIINLNISNA